MIQNHLAVFLIDRKPRQIVGGEVLNLTLSELSLDISCLTHVFARDVLCPVVKKMY